MSRSERLAALLATIEKNGVQTSHDLALRFGTSIRTIYRDICDLRRDGWRIPGEAGVGYMFKGRERP